MPGPFERLADLNRLVHEPARLSILTALSVCRSADFLFLLRLTGLTKGNLSVHLRKLEDAGYVEITKTHRGRTPTTLVALTRRGRVAFDDYTTAVRALLEPKETK